MAYLGGSLIDVVIAWEIQVANEEDLQECCIISTPRRAALLRVYTTRTGRHVIVDHLHETSIFKSVECKINLAWCDNWIMKTCSNTGLLWAIATWMYLCMSDKTVQTTVLGQAIHVQQHSTSTTSQPIHPTDHERSHGTSFVVTTWPRTQQLDCFTICIWDEIKFFLKDWCERRRVFVILDNWLCMCVAQSFGTAYLC